MANADIFQISGRNYGVIGKLGEGSYAIVFTARSESGDKVAIKRSSALEPEDIEACKKEIEIMRDIQHECILGSFASEVKKRGDTRVSYLVMPHAEHGNLIAVVNRHMKTNKVMNEKVILTAILSVASGISHLHSLNPPIAHRDMKAENVLCFGPFNYKICDFGSSTTYSFQCSNGKDMTFVEDDLNRKTTLAYRAPEQCALMSRLRIDERVDNWAIGVILYLLCFFQCPFPDSAVAISQCNYSFPSRRLSPQMKQLIQDILIKDSDARPSAYDIFHKANEVLGELFRNHTCDVPKPKQPAGAKQPHHPSLSPLKQTASVPQVAQKTQPPKATPAPKPKAGGLFGMIDWAEDTRGSSPPPQAVNLFSSPQGINTGNAPAQSLFSSPQPQQVSPQQPQQVPMRQQPPSQPRQQPVRPVAADDFFSSLGSPQPAQPPASNAGNGSLFGSQPAQMFPTQNQSHGDNDLFPAQSSLDVLSGLAPSNQQPQQQPFQQQYQQPQQQQNIADFFSQNNNFQAQQPQQQQQPQQKQSAHDILSDLF